ncbi:hypothetical protein CW362_17065 [Streptomyces populi]|uniref:Uncharacterized protein n=1 Tax=Streptomyces populi TaxID=2058924 RepID=A0A2I0SPD1_9ACTN|nr:hypothetical protein [Streptomyces populi]PKT71796.1 hypothetical protein CW362_17065 [Streptomyces populi]
MSIISSIPVLLGDRGAELRADSGGLLLRRPREEVRVPLAALARVHANGRAVTVELTAPAGTESTLYRIEGVSRASGTVFAEAVNGSLPERPAGEDPVDGSTLVTVTPRDVAGAGREEDDGDAEPLQPAELVLRCTMVAVGLGLVVLAAGIVVAGDHVSRALAVLLLGGTGLAIGRLTARTVALLWNEWYLPRHGITVEAQPVLVHGEVAYGYTTTDGRLRPVPGNVRSVRGETYDVAYHPKHHSRVVACQSLGAVFKWLPVPVVLTAVTVLVGWGTAALALPAFR